jgi:hypothetical protein
MESVTGAVAGIPAQPAKTVSVNPATERRKHLMALPLFRKASEVLGAQIWLVDDEFNPDAQPKPASAANDDPEEE